MAPVGSGKQGSVEVDIHVAEHEIGIGGEVDAQLEEEDERVRGVNG